MSVAAAATEVLSSLAHDVLEAVCAHLHPDDVLAAALSCRALWRAASRSAPWRTSFEAAFVSVPRMQWALDSGLVPSPKLAVRASASGLLHLLPLLPAQMIFAKGAACMEAAARHGHLSTLKWLHARQVIIHKGVCEVAAAGGYLEVLKWALDNGAECCLGKVCYHAADGGHLEVLKWAHSKGAVLDVVL
jgi:hypothetical protein